MIKVTKATSDPRPIGVFDSGVGGLSVLIELQKTLPHENYIFVADQLHVPYGEKSRAQLENLTVKITSFLASHNAKLIVVACNTATCYAIDTLRKRFSMPFVGTVPAVKPAAIASKTKCIAVLSTPATAKSPALKKLISDFGKGTAVLRIGCAGLEDAVESGSLHSATTKKLLKRYLHIAQTANADQIVLGCTHYPFLKKSIHTVVGNKVGLLDSGKALALQTSNLLEKHELKNTSLGGSKVLYFTTGDARKFSKVATKLMRKKISSRKVII